MYILKMKIYTSILLVLFCLLPCFGKGKWDVGGKVSIINPNSNPKFKMVATAEYLFQKTLSWRTDLELLSDKLDPSAGVDVSIPSNILWYPLSYQSPLSPYIGPGLGVTLTRSGDFFFGSNVLAGLSLRLKNKKTVGIEVKYGVTDMFSWAASDHFEIGLKGNWEMEF